MGTRHLILVAKSRAGNDNQDSRYGQFGGYPVPFYPLAQYGQWDGYPSGQGAAILTFLRERFDRAKFEAGLAHLYEPTEEQSAAMWAEFGVDIVKSDGMVSFDKSEEYAKRYPSMHRNNGAKILDQIQDATGPIPTRSELAFAGDGLFCEWGYVIDLDANTFEVFEGFSKEPTPPDSRFPSGAAWLSKDNEYEPIRLKHKFDLDALPTEEEFLAILEPANEEDSEAA